MSSSGTLGFSESILLVMHLVHKWKLEIQDFNELNEGFMTIFHDWTKDYASGYNKYNWKVWCLQFEYHLN